MPASRALHRGVSTGTNFVTATATPEAAASDIDILNFALFMEHLANACYTEAEAFDLGETVTGSSINQLFSLIHLHTAAHVGTLIEDISQRGGTPVARPAYRFDVPDAAAFLTLAVDVSDLLVSTYYGGMSNITDPRILVGASQFAGVCARISTMIKSVAGDQPFPGAFEQPLAPADVRSLANTYLA